MAGDESSSPSLINQSGGSKTRSQPPPIETFPEFGEEPETGHCEVMPLHRLMQYGTESTSQVIHTLLSNAHHSESDGYFGTAA
ncbi:MAG: hypothetical protein CMJ78_18360 [Planctomycetaceae bacterium]|nr:hypothetical protein [Planctomycetaceae bacterium]